MLDVFRQQYAVTVFFDVMIRHETKMVSSTTNETKMLLNLPLQEFTADVFYQLYM